MDIWDYAVLLAYFGILVGIGWRASRRQKDMTQYFVGGRRTGTLAIMTLWMASWVGGATILGTAEQAYEMGLRSLLYPCAIAFGCVLFALTFTGKIKEAGDAHGHITYPDFIEKHYGSRCRVVSTVTAFCANIGYTSSQLLATALIMNQLTGWSLGLSFVVSTAVTVLYTAAGGFLAGWTIDGKPNPAWMSTFTYPFQEGVLSGAGGIIGGVPIGKSIAHTDEVNKAAGKIANFSGPAKDVVQGNHLDVREVQANADVVRASGSVAESMENLRRLAEERLGKIELNSGLEYGTIAIQRYERSDGTNSWLVTIPGTDGQPDSPFGWAQNVELMSADQERRRKADSARMVAEAMRQAGIGKDEPVALIGHSQGGIVAATLASDWAEEYTIEHVVTAGSPVANHPIPQRTWVTSVEIDDELVAALDGAANPVTDNWLTVQGHVSPAPAATPSTVHSDGSCTPGATPITGLTPYDAASVAGSTNGRELSHWLKYHQAAYQNATDLGSPAVQRHEAHFQEVINGELKETRYYQGRMTQSTTIAPGERTTEFSTFGG